MEPIKTPQGMIYSTSQPAKIIVPFKTNIEFPAHPHSSGRSLRELSVRALTLSEIEKAVQKDPQQLDLLVQYKDLRNNYGDLFLRLALKYEKGPLVKQIAYENPENLLKICMAHKDWETFDYLWNEQLIIVDKTLLAEAVQQGYIPDVEFLGKIICLSVMELFIELKIPITNKMMIRMAFEGWNELLEVGLKKGVGIPPEAIGAAASQKHLNTVKFLIDHNAPIHAQTLSAATNGTEEIGIELMKYATKLKDGSWAWMSRNHYTMNALFFISSKKAKHLYYQYENHEHQPRDEDLEAFIRNLAFDGKQLAKENSLFLDYYFDYLLVITPEVKKYVVYWTCMIENDDRALKYTKALIEKGAEVTPCAIARAVEFNNRKTFNYLKTLGVPLKEVESVYLIRGEYEELESLLKDSHLAVHVIHIFSEINTQTKKIVMDAIKYQLSKRHLPLDFLDQLIAIIQKEEDDSNIDFCDFYEEMVNVHYRFLLPLELIYLYLHEPKKLWDKLHPTYKVPDDLKKYTPWGFDPEIYNEILVHTKQACEDEMNQGAELHAYKLTVLFGSAKEALEYLELKKSKAGNSKQPVHDACLFTLPETGLWSIQPWKRFLKKEGFDSVKMEILTFAPLIENHLAPDLPLYHAMVERFPKSEIVEQYRRALFSQCRRAHGEEFTNLEKTRDQKKIRNFLWGFIKNRFPLQLEQMIMNKLPSEKLIQKQYIYQEILGLAGIVMAEACHYSGVYHEYKKTHPREMKESFNLMFQDHSFSGEDEEEIDFLSHKRARSKIEVGLEVTQPLTEVAQMLSSMTNIAEQKYTFLTQISFQIIYGKLVDQEYHQFSQDCIKAGISKHTYDEIMTNLKYNLKYYDYIPDVKIDGALVGSPKYYLEKMRSDDPYMFILGKKTSCCQSINGHSRDAVLHGATSHFGSFLRIMKKGSRDPWVAQGWIGLGLNPVTKEFELVIDSIEHNKGHHPRIIMDLFELAAIDMLRREPRLVRVVFGGGGNTPPNTEYPQQYKPFSKIIGYKGIGYDSTSTRYILADRLTMDLQVAKILENSIDHTQLAPTISEITADGFVITRGTDRYVNPGKKLNGISLNIWDRTRFFEKHPEAKRLMSHPENPILEEGFYDKSKSERVGEDFIPFPAFKKIVHSKFASKVEHLVLVDNSYSQLCSELRNIPQLQESQRILIGYGSKVHVHAGYVQAYRGRLRGIVFDSEFVNIAEDEVYKALKETFPKIEISYVKAHLQKDHFSCSTYVIQGMSYFAKHGSDIWEMGDVSPAPLLKMAQKFDFDSLSPEILNAIVSEKKKLSLKEYIRRHAFVFNGREYNLAAIRKKYRLLSKLEPQ